MAFITNSDINNTRIYEKDKEDVAYDLAINQDGAMPTSIQSSASAVIQKASGLAPMKIKGEKHYDWKTKNESFLELYNDYYKMGIDNNKFHLRILDTDLIGIDPFSPVLPLELQLKVFLEVVRNPWYFLREVCRIPVDGAPIEIGGGSEFKIDRNSAASWYLFLNGIDHYDSKSRQLGKTQGALSELDYAFNFGAMSSTFLFFNKDQSLAKQNLYRLKCQRDMLPAYLQMKVAIDENGKIDKGIDNITQMRNPITNNVIKVMPKATSSSMAAKLGRGETAAFHYCDEHDFTPYNTEIQKAAAFAYSTASTNAKKNNCLYGRIMTSTPGYLSTKEGKAAAEQIDKMVKWKDKYLDTPINKFKKIVNSTKHNRIVYNEHTWQQLKKPLKWYEDQCGLVEFDEDTILREIDLKRIQGNTRSPFKKQDLAYIVRNQKHPIEELDLRGDLSYIKIYEKLDSRIHYILSIDPSEGLDEDNNAFTLLNPHTELPVAEYQCPYISPPNYFRLIDQFLTKYAPRAMIIVEANKGRELINRFSESKWQSHLWYNTSKLEGKVVEKYDANYNRERQEAIERRAIGFDTTPASRPRLFSILETLMEEEKNKICTEYIVTDVSGLERTGVSGRVAAGPGAHDDNVMSWLIGLFVLRNADNLEEFGIYPGKSAPEVYDDTTPEGKRNKIKSVLNMLPDNVRGLFESVLQETDPVDAERKYSMQVNKDLRKAEVFQNASIEEDDIYNDYDNDILWDELERNMLDRNFSMNSDSPRGSTFNMDDYL